MARLVDTHMRHGTRAPRKGGNSLPNLASRPRVGRGWDLPTQLGAGTHVPLIDPNCA